MTQPIVRLQRIARAAMVERGLEPDFPPPARAEANRAHAAPIATSSQVRDMRHLLWCSIDNDDSRDLDQLSVAQPLPKGDTRILVAIADVDGLEIGRAHV